MKSIIHARPPNEMNQPTRFEKNEKKKKQLPNEKKEEREKKKLVAQSKY